jgi:DNA-binding CsgD family transcriptional regulator
LETATEFQHPKSNTFYLSSKPSLGSSPTMIDKQPKPTKRESNSDEFLENALASFDVTSEPLTKCETEILNLIISGKSNKEMASILCRSKRTVESHRGHVMRKLGVNNIAHLVKIAVKIGLI